MPAMFRNVNINDIFALPILSRTLPLQKLSVFVYTHYRDVTVFYAHIGLRRSTFLPARKEIARSTTTV